MHCRYRFVDISYLRAEEVIKGKTIPEHTEHVVMFLPDIWSVVPTMMEYLSLQASYKRCLLIKLGQQEEPKKPAVTEDQPTPLPEAATDPPTTPAAAPAPAVEPETSTAQSSQSQALIIYSSFL